MWTVLWATATPLPYFQQVLFTTQRFALACFRKGNKVPRLRVIRGAGCFAFDVMFYANLACGLASPTTLVRFALPLFALRTGYQYELWHEGKEVYTFFA